MDTYQRGYQRYITIDELINAVNDEGCHFNRSILEKWQHIHHFPLTQKINGLKGRYYPSVMIPIAKDLIRYKDRYRSLSIALLMIDREITRFLWPLRSLQRYCSNFWTQDEYLYAYCDDNEIASISGLTLEQISRIKNNVEPHLLFRTNYSVHFHTMDEYLDFCSYWFSARQNQIEDFFGLLNPSNELRDKWVKLKEEFYLELAIKRLFSQALEVQTYYLLPV